MAATEPVAEPILPGDEGPPTPWTQAGERLAAARTYWLATTGPGGRPHIRPLIGIVVDGILQVSSSPGSRKSRNLEHNASCAVTASCEGFDMVVEGTAARVDDASLLRRAADAFQTKYGWPLSVRDGAFHAEYGAPTAGDPPYHLYALTPVTAFGFPTSGSFTPTRWRFAAGRP
ncbi:pyridoxamine 5'-phosphate oxidase family protein [Streptosporangium carneum]|uniref:pyridoxamine 5'-phosphate oxidase family protein n=1 Tax=Streptosporangium carneum TaxID=47481 RepID=UPI0022F30692|nr:pyridoxamine 5'-phosphate oxidase family protein [Streptosporangium carneum]